MTLSSKQTLNLPYFIFCAFIVLALHSCGATVETGKNNDPGKWPQPPLSPTSDIEGQTPETEDDAPGTTVTSGTALSTSCFRSESTELPTKLHTMCDGVLKADPKLVKVHYYLCVKKFLVNALDVSACGWRGDAKNIINYTKVYEREPESSGKNYEDVHATIISPQVPATKFIEFVRLAFENYKEFKNRGYFWLAGTRENTNLNQGTLESGVRYRFRLEKDAYELGYAGHIKLIPLDENTWIQVNVADSDFVRVQHLAQVTLIKRQPDNTVVVAKLEHKIVDSSGGLYNRAWKGAIEVMKDLMIKTWDSITRSKS